MYHAGVSAASDHPSDPAAQEAPATDLSPQELATQSMNELKALLSDQLQQGAITQEQFDDEMRVHRDKLCELVEAADDSSSFDSCDVSTTSGSAEAKVYRMGEAINAQLTNIESAALMACTALKHLGSEIEGSWTEALRDLVQSKRSEVSAMQGYLCDERDSAKHTKGHLERAVVDWSDVLADLPDTGILEDALFQLIKALRQNRAASDWCHASRIVEESQTFALDMLSALQPPREAEDDGSTFSLWMTAAADKKLLRDISFQMGLESEKWAPLLAAGAYTHQQPPVEETVASLLKRAQPSFQHEASQAEEISHRDANAGWQNIVDTLLNNIPTTDGQTPSTVQFGLVVHLAAEGGRTMEILLPALELVSFLPLRSISQLFAELWRAQDSTRSRSLQALASKMQEPCDPENIPKELNRIEPLLSDRIIIRDVCLLLDQLTPDHRDMVRCLLEAHNHLPSPRILVDAMQLVHAALPAKIVAILRRSFLDLVQADALHDAAEAPSAEGQRLKTLFKDTAVGAVMDFAASLPQSVEPGAPPPSCTDAQDALETIGRLLLHPVTAALDDLVSQAAPGRFHAEHAIAFGWLQVLKRDIANAGEHAPRSLKDFVPKAAKTILADAPWVTDDVHVLEMMECMQTELTWSSNGSTPIAALTVTLGGPQRARFLDAFLRRTLSNRVDATLLDSSALYFKEYLSSACAAFASVKEALLLLSHTEGPVTQGSVYQSMRPLFDRLALIAPPIVSLTRLSDETAAASAVMQALSSLERGAMSCVLHQLRLDFLNRLIAQEERLIGGLDMLLALVREASCGLTVADSSSAPETPHRMSEAIAAMRGLRGAADEFVTCCDENVVFACEELV